MYKKGECLCGEVKYQIDREPLFVQACHCTLCQTTTGSAFNLIMQIETKHFKVTNGEPITYEFKGGSGASYDVYSCKTCGTGLWGKPRNLIKDLTFIRSGTLLDTKDIKPLAHIFTVHKQDWLTLPIDTPKFDGMYELDKIWPIESLKRLKEI